MAARHAWRHARMCFSRAKPSFHAAREEQAPLERIVLLVLKPRMVAHPAVLPAAHWILPGSNAQAQDATGALAAGQATGSAGKGGSRAGSAGAAVGGSADAGAQPGISVLVLFSATGMLSAVLYIVINSRVR